MDDRTNRVHIDEPDLLSRAERTRDKTLTALMWVVYGLLWLPLLSLGAWLFGLEMAYDAMVRLGGASTLELTVVDWFYALVTIVVTIVAWSLLNRARFHNQKRRTQSVSVSDAEVCEWFRISPAELETMRSSKNIAVGFDDEGRPAVRRAR
jgi:biofilm PGA synthesis protein PgaD